MWCDFIAFLVLLLYSIRVTNDEMKETKRQNNTHTHLFSSPSEVPVLRFLVTSNLRDILLLCCFVHQLQPGLWGAKETLMSGTVGYFKYVQKGDRVINEVGWLSNGLSICSRCWIIEKILSLEKWRKRSSEDTFYSKGHHSGVHLVTLCFHILFSQTKEKFEKPACKTWLHISKKTET